MKKLFCLLLALGLLLSLCACGETASQETNDPTGNGWPVQTSRNPDTTIAPSSGTAEDPQETPDNAPIEDHETDQTDPAPSGSGDLTLLYHQQRQLSHSYTDAGFYHLTREEIRLADGRSARQLLYVDFATRQEIPLCSDASCSHDSTDCTAVFPTDTFAGNTALFVWGDSLYILSKEQDQDGTAVMGVLGDSSSTPVEAVPTYLYRANLDGTGRERICSLDGGLTVEDLVLGDRKGLYLVSKRVSSQQSGGSAYQTSTERMLCFVHMETGQVQEQLSLDLGDGIDWDIIGCSGRKLVLYGIDFGRSVSQGELHQDGTADLYQQSADVFSALDLDSGAFQELYRVAAPISRSYAVDSHHLYYSVTGKGVITRVDLQTGEQSALCTISQDAIWGMVGDQLYTRDERDRTLYFIDTATGAIRHCGLREKSMGSTLQFLAENPDSVLAIYDSDVTARADGSYTVRGYRYGLIRKEDLFAGRDAFQPIRMTGSGL